MKTKIKKIGLMICAIVGLLLTTSLASAAINKQITYQGKLTRPSDGQPVTDGSYDLVIRVYDAASGGNCLWSVRGDCGTPTAKSVTTSGGVFTTNLGESGDNALNLDFSTDSYYLGIKVGADDEMTPRRRITATPQSFNSNNVIGDGFINLNSIPTGAGICQGMLCLNPSSANATDTLLGIQSGSNPIFKVENDGKVGIGTNTPNRSLHIKTASGTNAEMDIQSGSNNLWAFYQDDTTGDLRCWNDSITGEKNALVLKNTGDVGIGTTNPGTFLNTSGTQVDSLLLDIQPGASQPGGVVVGSTGRNGAGTTNRQGYFLRRSDGWSSYPTGIYKSSDTNAGTEYWENLIIGNNGGNPSIIFTQNLAEVMRLDGAGKLGIGATGTLSSKVSISRTVPASVSVANSSLYLRGSDNGYGLAMGTLSDGSTWLQGMLNDAASVPINLNPSGGAVNIGGGTTNLNNGTSNMILFNTAGVAAPTFTTRSAGTKIVLYPNLSSTLTDFALGMEGSTMWSSVPGAGNNFKWYAGTTQIMLLDSSGNLTANSFIYSSDQRLKKDIKPLSNNTLENIKHIQPVSFNWKDSGKEDIGFIAQNVEEVYPELVSTDPNTGMKGLKYGNMTAVLMEAIKEQQKQIDELKQEVEALKNQ